jgi:hypothetical protein
LVAKQQHNLTYLLTYLQFSVIKWAKQHPGQSPIDVKSYLAYSQTWLQRKSGKNGCKRQEKNRFVILQLFGNLREHGSKFGEHNPVFWRFVFERKRILPVSVPYNFIFRI